MGNHVTKKHLYDAAHDALHWKRERSGKQSSSPDAVRHRAQYWAEKKLGRRTHKGEDVDHIDPLVDGGHNTPGNTRVISTHLNRGLGGRMNKGKKHKLTLVPHKRPSKK